MHASPLPYARAGGDDQDGLGLTSATIYLYITVGGLTIHRYDLAPAWLNLEIVPTNDTEASSPSHPS